MKHKCDHDNYVNDKYNTFHDNRHYIHNRKNNCSINNNNDDDDGNDNYNIIIINNNNATHDG